MGEKGQAVLPTVNPVTGEPARNAAAPTAGPSIKGASNPAGAENSSPSASLGPQGFGNLINPATPPSSAGSNLAGSLTPAQAQADQNSLAQTMIGGSRGMTSPTQGPGGAVSQSASGIEGAVSGVITGGAQDAASAVHGAAGSPAPAPTGGEKGQAGLPLSPMADLAAALKEA